MEKFIIKPFKELSNIEVFEIARIRTDVFVAEQKITVPEMDDQDITAYHVLLPNQNNTNALAYCRFFLDKDNRYYIGRVATLKEARGQGLASEMLSQVHSFLKKNNLTDTVYLHAQKQVIPFYEINGYQKVGQEFMEAGIPHQLMKKKL